MRNVEPKVYLIAKTVMQPEAAQWLADIGASGYPAEGFGAKLVQLCGKRCYMSFKAGLNPNVTRVRDDMAAFIDNILEVSHGSVLEHASYSFAIEGVSRVFTGEMNRHRAGMAISEGSMRYIRFDDISYWMPNSLQEAEGDSEELQRKKLLSRAVFYSAFQQAEECYTELLAIWAEELAPESKFAAKKQITSMMRRIIPMGVASGGVWTGNLRALRHVFTMRCDSAAEEEICLVACLLLACMREAEPLFFGDFKLVDGYWKPEHVKV